MKNKQKQLYFAHANGFPTASYRQVFKGLASNINLIAPPTLSLESKLNKNNNWQHLVDELILICEAKKHPQQPLWAVGHSMGAIVSFKACCQRPDLFDGLIMLDPPLVTGLFAPLIKVIKRTSLIDKITPAGLSALRKTYWSESENPVDYFKAKSLFKEMPEQSILDYVEAGLVKVDKGANLRIPVNTEVALFRQVPDDLNHYESKLLCPGFLVTGHKSNVCVPMMYKRFIKKNKLKHLSTSGGHMFPLEHPLATARLLGQLINN